MKHKQSIPSKAVIEEYASLPKTRKEAKLLGAPVYFTGKKCKQGHRAPKRTHNGECKACQKSRDAKHRKKNAERRRKSFRDWYHANHDEQLVRMKEWQQNNRDWFNEYESQKKQNDPFCMMTDTLNASSCIPQQFTTLSRQR